MITLLAKSPRGGRTLTLHQHLLDTEQAASALFRKGTRWARAYLRFFKLPEDTHARFLLNLRHGSAAVDEDATPTPGDHEDDRGDQAD